MGRIAGSRAVGTDSRSDGCHRHVILSSRFGSFAIVWREAQSVSGICRVFLSRREAPAERSLFNAFPLSHEGQSRVVMNVGERIARFLEGEDVEFSLDHVAIDDCSDFQRAVLLAEYDIPRGFVNSYGRIASHLGKHGGARAVGRALAQNPFPVIIPCHRAIRSDGSLGGYQGGTSMKRKLLEYEGAEFSDTGKIVRPRMYRRPDATLCYDGGNRP